ncbi:DUF6230 family protein [Nocardioides kongjuensis]|uniref:Cholesterol esterase n=1 Tax=Nocardioides kongjuensis TaxID=349522 RepID=A0A852RM27_9ACTN|nr:DUF6230 family protein [Nocardioides kongjuensis]NYD31719.1 hypothetical protein [Nocardioides kongjuensis]
MGRTRLGRFAAVTVPATLLTAGLGVAMLQGMVGAVLSSADGFTLNSDRITSDGLKARTGAANVAGGNQATIYAETGANTNASGIEVVTPDVTIPLLGSKAHLEVASTDTTIALGSVGLNAKTLTTPNGATLGTTTIGVAQSEAGFANTAADSGYVADGFALTSSSADLPNVNAKAYAITLQSLALDNLSLSVALGN